MIGRDCLDGYAGARLATGERFLYAPPRAALAPFVSCYTLSFPTPETMSAGYTVLPSASATIVAAADGRGVSVNLRGVNSRAVNVGAYANRMRALLLIEFRPGCLFPFLSVDQKEILDRSLSLAELDARLAGAVSEALICAAGAADLFSRIDEILINRMASPARQPLVGAAIRLIREGGGARELAGAFHYGEKQLRRIFLAHVGMGPKAFARVARVNRAIRLLQSPRLTRAEIAQRAGYFDQPHLLRDFRELCGVSPREYLSSMSDFYNDAYKI